MSMYSQVFLGKDHANTTQFSLDRFSPRSETVLLNNERKVRTLDYIVTNDKGSAVGITLLNGPLSDKDTLVVYTDHLDLLRHESLDEGLAAVNAATSGSWHWDKLTGILTMYDTSGNEQFKFDVKDDADSASRERRQDLEV